MSEARALGLFKAKLSADDCIKTRLRGSAVDNEFLWACVLVSASHRKGLVNVESLMEALPAAFTHASQSAVKSLLD